MTADKNARLEDYGVRNATTPEQRLAVYKEQGRGLPKLKKALFWMGVLEADPEVAKLCKANGTPRKSKRVRPSKFENVGVHKEIGLIEENGVCQ